MRSTILVFLAASCLAAGGATDYAGGWNDGSRLATVESLVERGTWAIDNSIFVRPPDSNVTPHPYGPHAERYPTGTLDKLLIAGHFYSDKSPVPAVLLAGGYQVYHWCGGPSAADRPDLFCQTMTWLNSAFSYGLAVACMFVLVRRSELPLAMQTLLVGSFALGSLAWPYSRVVNNHILLLGVTAALMVALEARRFMLAGMLAGLAYSIDLGAGPVICAGAGLWVMWQHPRHEFSRTLKFALAALPFFLLHHVLNYVIGGSWKPANANPAYFLWPGCPFNASNMTGAWNHRSPLHFILYSLDLLVGRKGLMGHNPPLVLLCFAPVWIWRGRAPLAKLCITWCLGIWLLYAVTSRNYSGDCISVRWFVPLAAPGYYLLIQLCRARPDGWPFAVVLAMAGAIINAAAFVAGPWSGQVVWGYWMWLGMAGIACGWQFHRHSRRNESHLETSIRQAA